MVRLLDSKRCSAGRWAEIARFQGLDEPKGLVVVRRWDGGAAWRAVSCPVSEGEPYPTVAR
jgi:hypothetical protein